MRKPTIRKPAPRDSGDFEVFWRDHRATVEQLLRVAFSAGFSAGFERAWNDALDSFDRAAAKGRQPDEGTAS